MIFDDEKRRKKESEEFEKIVREMKKIIEDSFKSAFDTKPFMKGFSSLQMDEKGEIDIGELNHKIENEDIFEDESNIYVTLELPRANEKDIKIKLSDDNLLIKTDYEVKEIILPSKVKRKIKKSFRNGILDIELNKIDTTQD